ncbi:alpha/beta hydrolase [Falsirhodobacter sp. 1013]|uniref:alpha/beta hydrolase n=1 Tax=Falsirhodobacter sp. 1013 TaxID=3417566 RepID=UPI003EB6BA73
MRNFLLFHLLPVLLAAGCAERPQSATLWPVADPPAAGKQLELFVATTRTPAPMAADGFTDGRAPAPSYAEFTLSLPPNHVPGTIEWPEKGHPDPRTDFAVTRHLKLDKSTFVDRIERDASKETIVFVHGFNYSFQETLFRFGQLVSDSGLGGSAVLFSWPSSASGYGNDKEAATYSRDALADLLTELAQQSGKEPITVFGHSMGGWLVMEALRQMRIAGKDEALSRLAVVLAAPDIDVNVFRAQISVIGPMKIPLTVLVSSDDRALRASSAIAGRHPRLGSVALDDPLVQATAAENNVTMIDISSVSATSGMNHDRYIELVSSYPALAREMRSEHHMTHAGTFVLDAAGGLLTAPVRAVEAAIGD